MNVLVSGKEIHIGIYSLSLSLECHYACKGPCTGGTVDDCVECSEGYQNVSGRCTGR